jgi:hypothetical protein
MQGYRAVFSITTALGFLCASVSALAQTATTAPPLKTIGTPSSAKPDVVPSLIVTNARGANLEGQALTLSGVAPNSIVFADRPVRAAGHELTAQLRQGPPERHRFGLQQGRRISQGCRRSVEEPEA